MTTLEEFEAAPVGATATNQDGVARAIRTFDDEADIPWLTSLGGWFSSEELAHCGWTLDPSPAPKTAREALNMAWELAHPVKEGQVIPEGFFYLSRATDGTIRPFQAISDLEFYSPTTFRTLDPLPEPEPDWLDAPAVLARLEAGEAATEPEVWIPVGDGMYARAYHSEHTHWSDLRRVTPLYPKGQDA